MKEKTMRFMPLVLLLVLAAVLLVPKWLEERACNAFAAPLYSHAVPEGAVLIEKAAAKDDDGGITAALLLETDLSSEELVQFYSDEDYPPAGEGQTVTLEAKELDESSIAAMKQAKLYEEGKQYQFVYLYSK